VKKIEAYPIKVSSPATVDNCSVTPVCAYILGALSENGLALENRDILVVTSKLVSIFEGRTIELAGINPSLRARLFGKVFGKDPKKMELILRQGRVRAVVPMKWIGKIASMWDRLSACTGNPDTLRRLYNRYSAAFMAGTHGVLLDDAGIDLSNAPDGWASLLPEDADESAKNIRSGIYHSTGKDIAVIITDTAAAPFKLGGRDIALGCAGIDPLGRQYAAPDVFGNPKMGGLDLIADPLAGLGGLIMGQTNEATPLCLIRGYVFQEEREAGGMKVCSYPRDALWQSCIYVMAATALYYILYLLSLPLRYLGMDHNSHSE
jgi:coenzyme F420-0:L-glutamate ligase / coenzyme F420-1:gamma-L-glutamate ligase